MKRLIKSLVIGAVLSAGTVGFLGMPRLAAMWAQAHGFVVGCIDDELSARVKLRAQIGDLKERLPSEIAALHGELQGVEVESSKLEREASIARRVIQLASADKASFGTELAAAKLVAVKYPGSPLSSGDVRRASDRVVQAESTIGMYAGQLEKLEVQIEFLASQKSCLSALIEDRELELVDFNERVALLEQEVETIERNERLIAWIEAREAKASPSSSFEAVSLDDLLGKFAQVRDNQSVALARLTEDSRNRDYERTARREMVLTNMRVSDSSK